MSLEGRVAELLHRIERVCAEMARLEAECRRLAECAQALAAEASRGA